jgi:hypothetical protein
MEAESKAGTIGLAVVASGVIMWDILAPETISSGFDRYLEHPVKRLAAIGGVVVVAAHLLNIPERLGLPDPVNELSRFVVEGVREALGHGELNHG